LRPLFGIDFSLVNQISGKFEYAKSRTLSLSLIDYQLSEVRSQVVTVGASWRKRGFPLPIKIKLSKKGPSKKLKTILRSDLILAFVTTQIPTADWIKATLSRRADKVITIQPSIDYVLSNRVNIKLYFDQAGESIYFFFGAHGQYQGGCTVEDLAGAITEYLVLSFVENFTFKY
jgi:cell surface protein SprA